MSVGSSKLSQAKMSVYDFFFKPFFMTTQLHGVILTNQPLNGSLPRITAAILGLGQTKL